MLVARLLAEEDPNIVHIEGSGGDGGADCISTGSGEVTVYQSKYYVSLLTSSQKRKIANSYNKAITNYHPTRWILCIPRDHTPAEKKWFDNLTEHGPKAEWWGETILRNLMGDHPRITEDHFPEASIKDLLKQLIEEKRIEEGSRRFSVGNLKHDIETASKRVRPGLNPSVLPPVPRTHVETQITSRLSNARNESDPVICMLVGSGGCGKSTVLGRLFDSISTDSTQPWVGLLRCNDVSLDSSLSAEQALLAFSAALDVPAPINAVTKELNSRFGRGILIIDTLDLMLNPELVPTVRSTLSAILDTGTTILVSCRDIEYVEYCEPIRQKLPGLEGYLTRFTLSDFAEEEVRYAATQYAEVMLQSEDGTAFGSQIVQLSADNRSLSTVTARPVLLAMLCNLFGGDAARVPTDLTVSRLYDLYWTERVSRARPSRNRFSLGVAQSKLCLEISSRLFRSSTTKLLDSIPEDELPTSSESAAHALFLLKSEYILLLGSHGTLRFFHQSFLEYGIARSLMPTSHLKQRRQLILESSKHPEDTPVFLWPILRQLLVLVDIDEFHLFIQSGKTSSLQIFRTCAQVASERAELDVLMSLVKQAVELTDEHERILLDALELLPTSSLLFSWDIGAFLILNGTWRSARRATETLGHVILKSANDDPCLLHNALNLVAKRVENDRTLANPIEKKKELWGVLLSPTASCTHPLGPRFLAALRGEYGNLNGSSRLTILMAHRDGSEEDCQRAVQIAQQFSPPSGSKELLTQMVLAAVDKNLSESTIENEDVSHLLDLQLPSGWEVILAKVVGRFMVSHPRFISPFLRKATADRSLWTHLLVSTSEALSSPDSEVIEATIGSLVSVPYDTFPNAILLQLLLSAGKHLSENDISRVLNWIPPNSLGRLPANVLVVLSMRSDRALTLLMSSLNKVSAPVTLRAIGSAISYVGENNRETLIARLSPILRKLELDSLSPDQKLQAAKIRKPQSIEEYRELIALAASREKGIALRSASIILSALEENPKIDLSHSELTPLLRSQFPGVRDKTLAALRIVMRRVPLTRDHLGTLAKLLSAEVEGTVVVALWRLVCDWANVTSLDSKDIKLLVALSMNRIMRDRLDPALSLLITRVLKVASRPLPLSKALVSVVIKLSRRIPLKLVKNGTNELLALFTTVAARDPRFLSRLVGETETFSNAVTLVVALTIRRVEGAASPLLDTLLDQAHCPPSVTNNILIWRRT